MDTAWVETSSLPLSYSDVPPRPRSEQTHKLPPTSASVEPCHGPGRGEGVGGAKVCGGGDSRRKSPLQAALQRGKEGRSRS